jgi:hypothetical protein
MASTEGIDWEDVASLNPKGDLEIQRRDQGDVIRGPLESITVDDHDNVVILYLESTPEVNTLDPKRVNGLKL